MAIFSKKQTEETVETTETAKPVVAGGTVSLGRPMLLLPRLSEKSSALARLNKYVFKVAIKVNKVEVRKAVEKQYGVKVATVNMIRVQGKGRRYGRFSGKTSDFKKAVVTLTPDSKKIDAVETA